MNNNEISNNSQTTSEESESLEGAQEKGLVDSPLELLVTLATTMRNLQLKIPEEDSIAKCHRPKRTKEKVRSDFFCRIITGEEYMQGETIEEENNSFLNEHDVKTFSRQVRTPNDNIITFPPKYKSINSLLVRAESATIDKLNLIYKKRMEELTRLAEKAVEENSPGSWKAEINKLSDEIKRLSMELTKRDNIIEKQQGEITSAKIIIAEKVISLSGRDFSNNL